MSTCRKLCTHITYIRACQQQLQCSLIFVCKIPLLARRTRPSARATIGYLVYKSYLTVTYFKDVKSNTHALSQSGSYNPKQVQPFIPLRGRLQRTSGKWGGGLVLKFRTFPGGGWFVKVRTSENF